MKQIVTIDFDILMAPSIGLYNNAVPGADWDSLEKNPYFQLLKIDAIHYQKIVNYIFHCIQYLPKENIHFIEDHGQAVKYINEKCDVINIDHHHDVGYGDDIEKQESPTCANWVYYLYKNNLLNNYTWIKNDNSEIIPLDRKINVPMITVDLNNFDLSSLDIPDELIICLSEPWVPPYIRPLFYTIMDICNQYYGIHFDIVCGPYLETNEAGPKHT
ncbi:MAG: hypothetical protein K5765_08670 [Clostridia bacterium]|nr:hypothetical protein [Clostridia bacterium]